MEKICGNCKNFITNDGECKRSCSPETRTDEINDQHSPEEGGCGKWEHKGLSYDYPENIEQIARWMIDEGDAYKFILDTWNERHVGDRVIGATFCCSINSTMIINTSGLHAKLSGASGKGKSDSAKKLLFLLPDSKKSIGSLSGKAIFYDEDIKAGTIIFSDDANINEDIITTIKQATTNFQSITYHRSVDTKRKSIKLEIPPRISWWLTTVNSFEDEQMGNRFITVDVETSQAQNEEIYKKQVELELQGITENTVDDRVLICRAIFDILSQETYEIVVPYAKAIQWENKDNSRNFPMFLDIIKSIALFRLGQLEKIDNRYITGIEDFWRASEIYASLADTHSTNLSNDELKTMRFIVREGTVDRKDIMEHLGCSYNHVKHLMHGKDGNSGLLLKIDGLNPTNQNISEGSNDRRVSTPQNLYTYLDMSDKFGLSSWGKVVAIDEDMALDEVKNYKDTYCTALHGDCTEIAHTLHSIYNTNIVSLDTYSKEYCTSKREYIHSLKKKENNSDNLDCASSDENCAIVAPVIETCCATPCNGLEAKPTDTETAVQYPVQSLPDETVDIKNLPRTAQKQLIKHLREFKNANYRSTPASNLDDNFLAGFLKAHEIYKNTTSRVKAVIKNMTIVNDWN